MYGPKGICEVMFLDLFKIDGMTITRAANDDKKIVKGILIHPNQNPTTAINFASPRPIPSLFLTFL